MSRLSIFSSDQAAIAKLGVRMLVFLAPLLVLAAIFEVAIYRTGDTWPIKRVVREQARLDSFLYRRGYFAQQFNIYKFEMIKQRRPDIVALGASRVMQVRDFMFHPIDDRFYNAGGMIQNLNDLARYARYVASGELPAPKVAIIGIDPWWLKPDGTGGDSWLEASQRRDEAFLASAHVLVARGFIENRNFPAAACRAGALSPSPYYGYPAIGAAALVFGAGFRFDGSRQGMPTVLFDYLDDPRYIDRDDPPIVSRIRNGTLQFSPPFHMDPERVDLLVTTLALLRDSGVEVVPFEPPFSSEVVAYAETAEEHAAWWRAFKVDIPRRLAEAGFPCLAVTEPADWGLSDLYMLDGWHPSEVFVAHIIRRLVDDAPPESYLKNVDPHHIDVILAGVDVFPLSFDVPPGREARR